MKLSIIVPCYNEEKNIPLILEKFNSVIKNKKIDKDSFISYFLHRKVRMYDRMTEMFNVLAIESMRIKEDETVLIRVQNIDDMYKQVFEFESIRHFENWFSKYGI